MAGHARLTDDKQLAKKMTLATLLLSGGILFSRILGFVREAVIASEYGAGLETDAYFAAFALPEMMSYFLAGGTLSITFIPLFSSYFAKGDEDGGWDLFSTTATTLGALLVFAMIILEIAAPYLVGYLNPGFVEDPKQLALAVEMTRIVIPAQLCFFGAGLLNATLFVRGVFWPSALSPLVYNLGIIGGGLILGPWFGIRGFAIGVLIGAIVGPLGIPLWASRKAIKFRFRFAPTDPGFKEFVILSLPLALGVGLVTVDSWILNYFGSQMEDGSISWLMNGRKLMLVCFALIGQAAGQAALPFFSRLFNEGKFEEMTALLAENLRRVVFFAAIASAGLIVMAKPIVVVMFRRRAFTEYAAEMTAVLLMCFAIGLVGWAIQTIAARGFYAQKNTIVPMIVSSSVALIALPLYWLLKEEWGVIGLALASAFGITLNAIATLVVFRFRNPSFRFGPILLGLRNGIAFGIGVVGIGYGVRAGLDVVWMSDSWWRYASELGISGALILVFFIAVIAMFHPTEFEPIRTRVASKLNR